MHAWVVLQTEQVLAGRHIHAPEPNVCRWRDSCSHSTRLLAGCCSSADPGRGLRLQTKRTASDRIAPCHMMQCNGICWSVQGRHPGAMSVIKDMKDTLQEYGLSGHVLFITPRFFTIAQQ